MPCRVSRRRGRQSRSCWRSRRPARSASSRGSRASAGAASTSHASWASGGAVSARPRLLVLPGRLAARRARRPLPALGPHAPARPDRRRRAGAHPRRRFAGRCSSSRCRSRSCGRSVTRAVARRLGGWLARPQVALGAWALSFGGWHVPAAYDFAARHQAVHDLEHASFVLAGFLVWSILIDPARHGRLSRGPASRGGRGAAGAWARRSPMC